MVWSTYDLSEITDALVGQLTTATRFSPLWASEGGVIPNFLINVTGNSPDTMRHGRDGECQLNFYLLHVAQSPYLRNTSAFGPTALANTQQPLGLDLTYLLTAYAAENADREQQAMSIALSWFHEQPVYSTAAGEYLTINLGPDTLSEMSALWQSFAASYRLSTLYRVAVAFLTPSRPPSTASPPPTAVGLVVAPAAAPLDQSPQVFQTARRVSFTLPASGADPDAVTATVAPLAITGGVPVLVGGEGLAGAPPPDIFLTTADGATRWTVTGWTTGTPPGSDLVLTPPAAYAIAAAPQPPATTPPPGVYRLSVGSGPSASPGVPVVIAPRFDDVLTPPVLGEVAGVYTVPGAGFTPGSTEVFLGGVALAPVQPPGATPTAGQFSVAPDGTSIVFARPASLAAGEAALRVRVGQVEAPPTWRVVVP